jgi:hypothetical protein
MELSNPIDARLRPERGVQHRTSISFRIGKRQAQRVVFALTFYAAEDDQSPVGLS